MYARGDGGVKGIGETNGSPGTTAWCTLFDRFRGTIEDLERWLRANGKVPEIVAPSRVKGGRALPLLAARLKEEVGLAAADEAAAEEAGDRTKAFWAREARVRAAMDLYFVERVRDKAIRVGREMEYATAGGTWHTDVRDTSKGAVKLVIKVRTLSPPFTSLPTTRD